MSDSDDGISMLEKGSSSVTASIADETSAVNGGSEASAKIESSRSSAESSRSSAYKSDSAHLPAKTAGRATHGRFPALNRTTAFSRGTVSTEVSKTWQRDSLPVNKNPLAPVFEKLISTFDFFFPQSASRLEIPAAFLKNCVRHRAPKNYYPLDKQSTFRAFRILSSETFRKISIFCALILAFLPTIEVPVSVPSPCWLSFLLELICYVVLSARVMVEVACYSSGIRTNPWSALLKFALLLSWTDVIVCMCLVASNGGDFLSFNNCGMPEPSQEPRSGSWVYIITRVSRYARPIFFMEWNYRTRYLFRNMVKITGKLINILSILFVVIFLFSSVAYFVWSDPDRFISTIGYRFDYFRSWFSAFVTMTTLTTTENYPDCMIDFMSVSFANFFFFFAFVLLSVFFALNVVLSTVYDTYEDNLSTYYVERLQRDKVTVARAFQHLCNADKLMTRERFREFMCVYEGMNHLDDSPTASNEVKRQLYELRIRADFMYSMCCIRRRLLMKGESPLLEAFNTEQISEQALMQKLMLITNAPISFSDFFELVSLMRYHLVVRRGKASFAFKNRTLKQISLTDIMKHASNMNSRQHAESNPISLHSSSYFIAGSSPSELLDSVLGDSAVLNMADLFSGGRPERLFKESIFKEKVRAVHDYWLSRWTCSFLIVAQFVLCVSQTIVSNAVIHCKRYEIEDAIQKDPWMFCESLQWYTQESAANVETSFNAAHLSMSFVLLVDVVVVMYLKSRRFFFTIDDRIELLNVFDAVVQIAIFLYDLVDLPLGSSGATNAVNRPEYVTFGILRLLRVHKVLSLATTVTDTIKLFRHLYPVIKAFFMIVYMFFFIWGILGMSLFSFAANENGIALYPTKSQYVDYYQKRAPDEYPNGNNPGNFGCNETDILGAPGFCGEFGPSSPQPHWDITPTTPEETAALDEAFVVGSGFDTRVGGCFNLIGQANNRVLPCYCYYNAQVMNRTTSCDWINTKWYNTQLGQVRTLVPYCLPLTRLHLKLSAVQLLDTQFQ
jgi:hypothetical protein